MIPAPRWTRPLMAGAMSLVLIASAWSCAPGEAKDGGTGPEPTLSLVLVTPSAITLEFGAVQQFSAAGQLSDGSNITPAVTWQSTGGSITSGGSYTAGSTAGTYRVVAVATENGMADTSTITVVAPPPTLSGVVLTPASVTLQAGSVQQFATVGQLSSGGTTTVTPTYTATGGTISGSGLYTAGSTAGTFRVIASASGFADTSAITITPVTTPPVLTAVILTPATVSMQTGATQQFAAIGRLNDGSNTSVSVTFSATGGTISGTGLYTAGASAGSFRVIAVDQDGSGLADTSAITLTVPPPTLTAVVLTPPTASLQFGQTQQFTATGLLSNGSTTSVTAAFTSTGGTVSSGGLYTAGNSAGSFRVIATASGLADTSTITITAPTLTSLSLTPATVTLAVGATQQFSVAGTWSNGTTTPPTVTYAGGSGGTITAGGLYTAGSTPGTYNLIASHSGGLKDTSVVTITAAAPTLTSLSLTPATVTLAAGATQQFTVSATWSNGTTTVPLVGYTVNSAAGGSVTAGGLYTAGSTAGSYQVIVAHTGGTLKDTSFVTVTGGGGGGTDTAHRRFRDYEH